MSRQSNCCYISDSSSTANTDIDDTNDTGDESLATSTIISYNLKMKDVINILRQRGDLAEAFLDDGHNSIITALSEEAIIYVTTALFISLNSPHTVKSYAVALRNYYHTRGLVIVAVKMYDIMIEVIRRLTTTT
jgi:hypothetical protein